LQFVTENACKKQLMMGQLVIIEVLQLLTRRGSFDIDDIILNTLGALIGLTIWKTKAIQYILNK
jgi:glycopeptide antibiotics resistance protein